MPSQEPKNFVIIGGSLGGLFCGIALKKLGHIVRLLERTPTPVLHDYGAGLVAGNETQEFLKRYDQSATSIAVVSPIRYYLNKNGDFINSQDWTQRMTSWDLVYHVLRSNFDGLQSDYVNSSSALIECGKVTYEYGTHLSHLEVKEDAVHLSLTVKTPTRASEEITADYVIAADGPSSTVRSRLYPDVKRSHAGYVLWRGTVPEADLSSQAAAAFVEKFTFYHSEGLQAIGYLIPGPNGILEHGKRTVNWACYRNFAEGSPELEDLMLDKDGRQHRWTLPRGSIRPEVWQKYQTDMEQRFPPQFAELARRTSDPFVQVISDVATSQAVYGGRVLFIGDALCTLRPHTAAGTSQAAKNALDLSAWAEGRITLEEWEKETLEYARKMQQHGINIGNRSQFETHPLAD